MTDAAMEALSATTRTAYASEAKYSRLDAARGLDYAAASNMFTYGPSWLATTLLAAIAPSFPGHASWVEAYYPPGCEAGKAPLYEWLLTFRRGA